jgi:uncharacterized membrane protein
MSDLPRYFEYLDSIEVVDDSRSVWTARFPGRLLVHWHAHLIGDVENEMVGWRSESGSQMDIAASVYFEQSDSNGVPGTELKAIVRYRPQKGTVGADLAELLSGVSKSHLRRALASFKAGMEGRLTEPDEVDVASTSSFPASDPPSWTASHA